MEVREFPGDPDTDAPRSLHPPTRVSTLVEKVERFVRRTIKATIVKISSYDATAAESSRICISQDREYSRLLTKF